MQCGELERLRPAGVCSVVKKHEHGRMSCRDAIKLLKPLVLDPRLLAFRVIKFQFLPHGGSLLKWL